MRKISEHPEGETKKLDKKNGKMKHHTAEVVENLQKEAKINNIGLNKPMQESESK